MAELQRIGEQDTELLNAQTNIWNHVASFIKFSSLKCAVQLHIPHMEPCSQLHNWSDEECVKILKKCKESIPPKEKGGKIIIIDIVVDNQGKDDKSIETQVFFDMVMMIPYNGKERAEKEWAKLFLEADFSDYKITSILGLRSIIEVYP